MALLNSADIETEDETRNSRVENVFLTEAPKIPGIEAVRHVTPLVLVALQRANNPFITGRKGFLALGVEFDIGGNQITEPSAMAILMQPKIAEAMVCLSCSRDELKKYATNPSALEDASLDLMERGCFTLQIMGEAATAIAEEFSAVGDSQVKESPAKKLPT